MAEMRESLIFSRNFNSGDIKRLLSNNYNLLNPADIGEEITTKESINLEEVSDLTNIFVKNINQKDIDRLDNDINLILEYFYFQELFINQYISDMYKDDNDKRHLYIRIADYSLRVQFEENESIEDAVEIIYKKIKEINESYNEKTNLKDLSDEIYLKKVREALGSEYIPLFLLREGYRKRRRIANLIKETQDENKEDVNDDYDNNINPENKNIEENKEIEEEDTSVESISQQIANNKKLPFGRKLNEVYIVLFFLSLKSIVNEGIYDIIKKNINKFIDYFKIDTYKNFNDIKKNYINVNEKNISTDIIKLELSKLDEYVFKYILASYYILIFKILKAGKDIYINLLVFLLNYISDKNIIKNEFFKKIIENEINRILSQNENDENEKNNYILKSYDYDSIKDIFNKSKNKKLKDEFNEVIKKEEKYEIGSNLLFTNVINLFKNFFKLKKHEEKNEDTIKNYLKLIPYSKNKIKGKNIFILISGYLSSEDNHPEEWKYLIKALENKFKNLLIYFYNWPSSKLRLNKFFYHWNDFKDARERAKYCGKLLALILMSNDFFKDAKISLCAFSLGNHIIKHCIKELKKFERTDILNNIIFIAGATNIEYNEKWENRFESIKGSVINCYSDKDLALYYCELITKKEPIGAKKLKFKKHKIKNYLTRGFHLSYRSNLETIGNIFIDDIVI